VVPSKEDLEAIKQKVESLYNEFQALAPVDVESYVKAHSDETYDSSFFKKGQLSVKLDSFMFASDVGAIIPPYQEDKAYYMARLVQIKNRPDSLKASHILIAYKEAPNPLQNITRTKDQAKKIADSLYEVVKKDAKIFGTLASVNSDFPTANKDGGDLGWIVDGDNEMKFFFDSAYVLKTGDVKVIESSMGYHVLYLTDKKESYKKVKVAVLKKDIKASSETFNKYLTDASAFAGENRTAEQFEKTVAEKGLNKRSAQFVREMDYSIPGLESARGIIRWAFNKDTKRGTVSEQVFDDDGKYIVVVLKEKREKGIAPLEQVKTYIEPLVKREKKAEKIVEQINTASGNDLYQIAAKINAVVDTVDALTLSAYNFPDFGPEPELIGTIFTLNKNSVSKPIKGKMAVYKVVVDDFIQPPAQITTDMVKMQLASYFRQRVSNDLFKAIKDKTEIVDNRIFFY
jgi:parvulin-like peptidyl-prolyl isomerase